MGNKVADISKPTKLLPDDNEAADKLRQELIVSRYIQKHSDEFDVIIPTDIIRLCLLFYQTHFEWKILLYKNKEKSIYNALFEISRLGTDIIATMQIQFEINKYNSMLTIKVKDIRSDKYRDQINNIPCRIYCHIICNQVNYEWKYTTTNMKRTPTICAFSKVPKDVVEFDCYFEILSKPIMRPRKHNLHSFAKYKWNLNEMIVNDMLNNIHRRFYSPNFNHGCFVLSMYNNKMQPNHKCRVLKFQLILLNDECIELGLIKKTYRIEGIISMIDIDNKSYQCKLPNTPFMHDNAMVTAQARIDRNVIIKSIEVTFKS